MDLKSTQYIEKTGSVQEDFLFLFLLFLSSIYNLFKFASLENEEVKYQIWCYLLRLPVMSSI